MAFADVLEETLASNSTTEGIVIPASAATYARPVGFFAFGSAPGRLIGSPTAKYRAAAAFAAAGAAGPALPEAGAALDTSAAPSSVEARTATPFTPRPRVRPRVARRLSPRQLRALDRLVELGAAISADFTAEELRSAYRGLARRYHPDHHPETSEIEKQRLARLFTQAHASYAELQDALAPAA
jgi:hypothetical protein